MISLMKTIACLPEIIFIDACSEESRDIVRENLDVRNVMVKLGLVLVNENKYGTSTGYRTHYFVIVLSKSIS